MGYTFRWWKLTTLIQAYISKPSDYPHAPSKLLLLLTGGTGIKSTNNQLQADKFASEGFLVVMPDQFDGDPAPNTTTDVPPEASTTFIEQFKLQAASTVKSFLLDMWLARHTSEKVLPILHKVIAGAKEEYADAVANGGGIYAVGYCFGAKYVLILGGVHPETEGTTEAPKDEEQAPSQQDALIKVGAIAHGTLVTKEDIDAVRVPISLACVENDTLFPEEILNAGRKSLETNKVEHEIEVYKKVPHGMFCRLSYLSSCL